jgi:glycosyltransferase involved in cell wall biosynthesis
MERLQGRRRNRARAPNGAEVTESLPRPSAEGRLVGKRICVVYDCLFPYTIGGAERWYRALAEGLAVEGARVTYLTRQQWSDETDPAIPGVEVVAVSRFESLYVEDGTRRTLEPIRFGWGVFAWLARHRREFDAVHIGNFPYFSIIGARAALAASGTTVSVDWHEVWPYRFWREYTGAIGGTLGYVVQQLCVRLSPQAFTFWGFTAERLRTHKFRGHITVLAGLLPVGDRHITAVTDLPASPIALFAGRHIKDKGLRFLPGVLKVAREQIPGLRLVIAGEGPETPLVVDRLEELGLREEVDLVGKVEDGRLAELISSASCVLVPSLREGYGMMVVEAAAHGTPSVVAANPENAATGHVIEGINGFVVEPTDVGIAEGIVRAVAGGRELRQSAAAWFVEGAASKGMDVSVCEVVSAYADGVGSADRVTT